MITDRLLFRTSLLAESRRDLINVHGLAITISLLLCAFD